MDIAFSISSAPSITDHLVVAAYNTTALNTVVASQDLGTDHTSSANVDLANLPSGTYYVKIWESADGSPTGTLRFQFYYSPSYKNLTFRLPLYIYADETAGFASGQGAYVDTSLAGWVYQVFLLGSGPLDPNKTIAIDDPGGWHYTDPSYKIGQGEGYCIVFQPQVTVTTDSSTSTPNGKIFSGQTVIISDITLTSVAMGGMLLLQGSGPTLNVTFPDPSTFPDSQMTVIQSDGGSHINASVIVGPNGSVRWLGTAADRMIFGQQESTIVFKIGSTYYAVSPTDGGWTRVGEFFITYSKADVALYKNALLCDGRLLSRVQYPRLWAWVQSLDSSLVIPDSQWTLQNPNSLQYENQALYSYGDGTATTGTTFRIPNLTNAAANGFPAAIGSGFLRGVNGSTEKAGRWQYDGVGNFFADIVGDNMAKAGNSNWVTVLKHSGSQGNPDANLGTNTITLGFTGRRKLVNDVSAGPANNETRPSNTGVYIMIRI